MYVYKNWRDGELAEGPRVDRHWVSASFMWPRENMPDPMAAKRLLDYGCKVKYEKTHLLEPRKVKGPDDFRPGTKKGKLDRKPVWLVEITMPKKLVEDTFDGYISNTPRLKNDWHHYTSAYLRLHFKSRGGRQNPPENSTRKHMTFSIRHSWTVRERWICSSRSMPIWF
jgi:hypothetical protein